MIGFPSFILCLVSAVRTSEVIELNVGNWSQILSDEWLVEFFAPWCPACQLLEPEWKHLAAISSDLEIKIASLDCTTEAAVATIFTITSLPTIFHVKDGEFRLVKGKRRADELETFIKLQQYQLIEPETWSLSPGAFYMPTLIRMLDMAMSMTRLHKYMVAQGMPTVLSFIIVATAILGSGACMGMMLLFIFEYCCPPRPQILRLFGMESQRPEPIVTKENDNDQDSVLDDSWAEMRSSDTGVAVEEAEGMEVQRRRR